MNIMINLKELMYSLAVENPAAGSIQSVRKLHAAIASHCEELGQGAFRTVYKAFDDHGYPVAIKIVNHQNNSDSYSDKQVYHSNQQEWDAYCNIVENFKHMLPFILSPLACWKVGGHCILVFPFVECIEEYDALGFNAYRDADMDFNRQYCQLFDNFKDVHEGNVGVYDGFPVLIDYNFESMSVFN